MFRFGPTLFLRSGGAALLAALLAGCSGGAPSTPASPVSPGVQSHDSTSPSVGFADTFAHELSSGLIRPVCPPAGFGVEQCYAYQLTNAAIAPRSEVPNIAGYGPTQLQSAYGIASQAASGGSGVTVAIVDAYNQENIVSDLANYRSTFGLPACGKGCFKVVNQKGGSKLPAGDEGWGVEESLDVEMVSANCPNCKIILVEANSSNGDDLYIAENEAVKLGAVAVSNSWGGGEYKGEIKDTKTYFDHPGVAIMASAGDSGYGAGFPATANTITSVGGTTLRTANNQRGWTETVWNGSGGGCSEYEAQPAWQKPVVKKLGGGCSKRVDNDLAYIADPNTGVAVYDTYGGYGWIVVGGTSVSSPAIAGIYALGGNTAGIPAKLAYKYASELNDVTSGANGSCSPKWLCNAETGFDGPTGNGTPNGTNGLDAF